MKKSILILSFFCCWHLGWAQKKVIETEEKYSLVRTTNVPAYYEGLLVTPFLCDYQALSEDPIEKTMTFDEINIFDYATTAQKSVATVYINRVKNAIIKENGATALVACIHDVETLKNGAIKVTVSGIPVKYSNFRSATDKDLWMLRFYKETGVPVEQGIVNLRVKDDKETQIKDDKETQK